MIQISIGWQVIGELAILGKTASGDSNTATVVFSQSTHTPAIGRSVPELDRPLYDPARRRQLQMFQPSARCMSLGCHQVICAFRRFPDFRTVRIVSGSWRENLSHHCGWCNARGKALSSMPCAGQFPGNFSCAASIRTSSISPA